MSERHSDRHWLTRLATIRRLRVGAGIVLVLTVMAQLFIGIPGSFALSGTFGFGAWFGFGVCVIVVLLARVLGRLLQRPEDYYGSSREAEEGGND